MKQVDLIRGVALRVLPRGLMYNCYMHSDFMMIERLLPLTFIVNMLLTITRVKLVRHVACSFMVCWFYCCY